MSTARHVRAEGIAARTSAVRALLGVALAVAVTGGVVVATHDDDTEAAAEVDMTGDDASTTSARRGTTTVPEDEPDGASDGSIDPPVVDDAPSGRLEPLITGTGRRTRATTPAEPSGCRNAVASDVDEPADCGPFRWDPVPANRPAELEVLVSHGQAPVGQPVTFTTRWADADAPSGHIRITGLSPDCADECAAPVPPACGDDRIGPWDPPRAVAGADDFVHTVEDLAPGTYDWTVTLTTSSVGDGLAGCDRDPYASTATVTGTLVVHPAFAPLGDGG